ncbi:MAG: radical SAM protein [Candidatus Omnitrophica bacterium]|nr:radical SAM protein [Candidatus Omnitrophota bacterium]
MQKIKYGLKLLGNILAIKLGMPRPIIAVWETTYRCNMRCAFCNEKNMAAKEMDTPEAIRMIEELAEIGTNIILLTGGEPTLRNDIDAIMDAVKKSGMTSIFTTNGLNAKNRISAILKADMIRLSVDGYGDVHDAIRGTPGAFESVRELVPILVKAGKPPMIVCVATRAADRENLKKLFAQAREWGVQVDLSMVTYSMRTKITSEDAKEVSSIQQDSRLGEADFLDTLDEFKEMFPDVLANPGFYRRLITDGGLGTRCRALDVSLNIRPDGTVSIPCDAFTLFKLEGDKHDVWRRMRGLKDVREKLGKYEFCNACYKRCIAFPSMLLSIKNLLDLVKAYLPTVRR